MSGRDIQSLLAQRRVTRAISEAVRTELSQHVSCLLYTSDAADE